MAATLRSDDACVNEISYYGAEDVSAEGADAK